MTDISIIGTGCLIVALVIAAGIVVRLRGRIAELEWSKLNDQAGIDALRVLKRQYESAEARRQAQRIAAAKKGREAQAAAKLAKKAAGQ